MPMNPDSEPLAPVLERAARILREDVVPREAWRGEVLSAVNLVARGSAATNGNGGRHAHATRRRSWSVQPLVAVSEVRPASGMKILLSPRAEQPFSKAVREGSEFVVAAGPEAGFTADEEAMLVSAGFAPASLGARVLRTETAAVAALAALNALRGDS